jgi:hypothetical protein
MPRRGRAFRPPSTTSRVQPRRPPVQPQRAPVQPQRAPVQPQRAPQFKPQMNPKGKNMSSRESRRAATKVAPSQNAQKRAANKKAAINQAAKGKTGPEAAAAKQKAALEFEKQNPKTTPGAMGAPAGAMGAPAGAMGASGAMGATPSAMDTSGAMGATPSAMDTSGSMGATPSAMGATPGTSGNTCSVNSANIHTIAKAIREIANKGGGKRSFTLRKRKTRRRKTRGRR